MEPDILRLILLVFGVVSLFSIYAWDRIRRRARDESEVMSGFTTDTPDILVEKKRFTAKAKKVTPPSLSAKNTAPATTPSLTTQPNAPVKQRAKPMQAKKSTIERMAEQQAQAQTHAQPAAQAPTDEQVPQEKIMVLNVVAPKSGMLDGKRILMAVNQEKLHYGDMKIFHRMDEQKNVVVFSLANMVEPGFFELEKMDQTNTPGITFFMRLPGPQDGMAMFSDMLFTVERFASTLGGQVVDARRMRLSKASLTSMQEEILAFEHALRLH